jgi:hypothetical protein
VLASFLERWRFSGLAQPDLVTANSVPCNGSAVASFVVLSRLLEQAHPK